MKGVVALLAGLGCCASSAQHSYSFYEMQKPTQRECTAALRPLQIRAGVDGRLAREHGDKHPFLVARSKQYQALLSAWQRACG